MFGYGSLFSRRVAVMVLMVVALMGMTQLAAGQTTIVAGPMIGHVGPKNARLWMQLSTAERVTVRAVEIIRNVDVSAVTIDVEGPAPFILDAPLSGLEPDRTYRVEVSFDGKPVKLPEPQVLIHSALAPGQIDNFTLAFGSGMDVDQFARMKIFGAVSATKPRAFLFLGDNGLLPVKEEEYPQTRKAARRLFNDLHRRVRVHPDLQELFRSTAIYATWNERDFGAASGDRTWVYSPESRVAFQSYWPNPDYGTPEFPGVYSSFVLGDVEVFLLDDRTFRDPISDPERKTMLGEGQLAWLKNGLKNSKANFKIIACGNPLLATTNVSGWGDYPEERDGFLAWLFQNRIDGVVFLSGGTLKGELSCRQPTEKKVTTYPLYELTSSPLAQQGVEAATTAPANPLRRGTVVEELNFGTLDFGGPRDNRHLTLRLRNAAGQVQLEQTILLSQLRTP